MAKKKYAIKLNVKVALPEWAVAADERGRLDFVGPLNQSPLGAPKPPVYVHNSSFAGITQLAVGKFLHLNTKGEIYILLREIPKEKAEASAFVEQVKQEITLLPAVWQWGAEIRAEQDEILRKIEELTGWTLALGPRDRIHFWHGAYKKVQEAVKQFVEAGEEIPAQPEEHICPYWAGNTLTKLFHETAAYQRELEANQQARKKFEEVVALARERERVAALRRGRKTLKAAGLLG